jgi:ribonuclease PH
MRPVRITPDYIKHPAGSVLVEYGDTKVICTVTAEDGVPSFLRNAQPSQGWLTAEYSMLPSATNTRTRRERQSISGRTQEIQRLIGRAVRGIIDLNALPEITLTIDCDVIQADGGTRTASITGAYVALKLAVQKLMRSGKIKRNPLKDGVAAVSIGLVGGELRVDLDYNEDSKAELDMNVVITHSGKFLEIQGTAEKEAFTKEQVFRIMELAEEALKPIYDAQHQAADGLVSEC